MTATVLGLTPPPTHRLPSLTKDEVIEVQGVMDQLSKAGFKPGAIRGKATQSHTKAMTAKCITAMARINRKWCSVGNVESYDAVRGRSSDLFGIIDLIAIDPQMTRGIQACGGGDWQQHIQKIADYDHARNTELWLASPHRTLELWGWRQYSAYKKDGRQGVKKFWYPRIQVITMGFLLGKEPPQYVKLEIN